MEYNQKVQLFALFRGILSKKSIQPKPFNPLYQPRLTFFLLFLYLSSGFTFTINIIESIMIPLSNNIKRIGDYAFDLSNTVGNGASGTVYRGKNEKDQTPVAVKVISQICFGCSELMRKLLMNEIKALKSVKHPNLIEFLGYNRIEGNCYIFSQLYEGGSLASLIKKRGKFSEIQALCLFDDIVEGYCQLTEKKILHRDLKTDNIMLRRNMEPVIIDFGLCQFLRENTMIKENFNVGTVSYQPPESYNHRQYSEKSDIWSLGLILNEMVTGQKLKIPREGAEKYFRSLSRKQYPQIYFEHNNEVINHLLKKCLSVDTSSRATANQLRQMMQKWKKEVNFSGLKEKASKEFIAFNLEEEIRMKKQKEQKLEKQIMKKLQKEQQKLVQEKKAKLSKKISSKKLK